jgi:hypothetical protein
MKTAVLFPARCDLGSIQSYTQHVSSRIFGVQNWNPIFKTTIAGIKKTRI